MNDLPKNKTTEIVVYCLSGRRGADASQIIADAGYKESITCKTASEHG